MVGAAASRVGGRVAVTRPVNVARRCEYHACIFRARGVERVDRPLQVDFQRFDRQRLVVAYARRRCQVVYFVAADAETVDDVVMDIPEQGMLEHVAQQGRIHGIADMTQKTSCPSSRRRRQRCVPINPTPPSTTIRFCISYSFYRSKSKIYSRKSARGSWSMLFIVTTSIPLGRLAPLPR